MQHVGHCVWGQLRSNTGQPRYIHRSMCVCVCVCGGRGVWVCADVCADVCVCADVGVSSCSVYVSEEEG